ncbi:ATP/GTP-binding protein [Thermococcus sp. JCM 11816]|uniref:AAA family ATPase n=1 Tax=Thermococcus sp. (strain JCM 11816 / KS-1) TaxID=1295125 RepID=UPI000A92DB13
MITSLQIENFRGGIKKLNLSNLGQINVIAGKNNAGKSSVLEALSLFLAAFGGIQSVKSALQEILIWRGWYGSQAIEDLFHSKAELARIVSTKIDASWELVLKKEMSGLNALPTLKVTLKQIDEEHPKFSAGFQIHNLVDNNVLSISLLSSKFDPPSLNFEFITPLTLRKFGYVESLYSIGYERKVVKESINILNEAYPEVEGGFSPLFKANKWILHVETKYGVYPYYLMGEGFKNAMIIAFLASLLKGGDTFS